MSGTVGAAILVALLALATGAAAAEEHRRSESLDGAVVERRPAREWGFLDTPPFPGMEITDAFRIDLGTLVAPEARVGSGRLTLVRPQLGLRADWPATDRLVLRVSGQLATSHYRFDGDPRRPFLGEDLDLYAARLAFEGAFHVTEAGPWFADDEIWSVLGSLSGDSRWEDDAFASGLGASGALGVGYELPDRLRIGLGVSLQTSLEEGGVDPGPFVSLRWNVTERFTVRTRDLGLRLEYDLTPALQVHVSGARESDGFRLRGRQAVPDDLTFRDRYLRFGAGVDYELANWLRLDLEIGSTAERRLRVRGDDLGTLSSRRVEPSLYLDVRFEVRL